MSCATAKKIRNSTRKLTRSKIGVTKTTLDAESLSEACHWTNLTKRKRSRLTKRYTTMPFESRLCENLRGKIRRTGLVKLADSGSEKPRGIETPPPPPSLMAMVEACHWPNLTKKRRTELTTTTKRSPKTETWFSEIVIPGPIPDIDALFVDRSLFVNFLSDLS